MCCRFNLITSINCKSIWVKYQILFNIESRQRHGGRPGKRSEPGPP